MSSSPASTSSPENSMSEAEKLIHRYDGDEQMIFCHGDHRQEADNYLQAVDEIQRSLESCTVASSSSGDRNKLKVSIEIAMARLEDEFKNLLNTHTKFIETDWLIDLNSSINSRNSISSRRGVGEEFTDDPQDYSEEFELQNSLSFDSGNGEPEVGESGSHSRSGSRGSTSYRSTSSIREIDLIPAEAINDLRSIAERMISAGYIRECLQVYTGIRKLAIESNFHHLKVENLSIGEVQRLKWDVVEEKIKKWIRAANICVRILFASEKKLCEQIFEGFEGFEGEDCDADEACFYDTVKGFAVQVLNFADAVSIGDRTPHKLFKILDLHDSLSKLIPDIEEVFDSKLSEGIPVHASEILARLADAARGMLIEFENLVIREPSQIPVPGGTIHPLTRYVMNYISLISDYKETLVELIVSKPVIVLVPSDPIASEMELQDSDNKSPLALHLVWIILNLHHNLDVKSQYYKDPSLPPLFLMNNIRYIVTKVKKGSAELQEMIGDSYLKKLSGKVRQSALAYQRSTLGRLLDCLRDEGLHVTGSFSSGVSKTLLRERFKSFNALFGDVHRNQVTWSVPDLQLREELRIALSETLIPAYRSFLGRFRGQIENGKHPELYIKYSVEDIENAVLDFFESHQNSLQSKRSR
ncbi:hypothetical protein MKW92_012496 [Papaver armeniacum]|nr:hypothetical protein MKW92_012496 [Papaver armeniacum]